MQTKTETEGSRGDIVKYALAALLMAGAVGAFYVYAEASLLLRVLGLLGVSLVAAAIVYQTAAGRQLWLFFQAARTEVRKVVWPTRTETLQTTLIVFVLVLLVGLFLWLLDWVFSTGFQWVDG